MGAPFRPVGRRLFLRVCAGGVGAIAIGCEGTLGPDAWVRDLGDAGPPVADAGRPAAGDDAPGAPADAGPGGGSPRDTGPPPAADAGPRGAPDAGPAPEECTEFVTMHDMNAQSLYYDGGYGPFTGVIGVERVIAGEAFELEFWHGHGGVNHRFTVTAAHLEALKRGERVTLTTTQVDAHDHTLFIDPVDERWRVSGAPDRQVPAC